MRGTQQTFVSLTSEEVYRQKAVPGVAGSSGETVEKLVLQNVFPIGQAEVKPAVVQEGRLGNVQDCNRKHCDVYYKGHELEEVSHKKLAKEFMKCAMQRSLSGVIKEPSTISPGRRVCCAHLPSLKNSNATFFLPPNPPLEPQ